MNRPSGDGEGRFRLPWAHACQTVRATADGHDPGEEVLGKDASEPLEPDFGFKVVLAADIDNDGDPDIIAAGAHNSPLAIFPNDGGVLMKSAWTSDEVDLSADDAAVADLDGTITYIPDPDFNGTDGFEYTVTDNQGLTATAQVEITARKSNGKKR